MLWITKTRLSYTDYYITIRRTRNFEYQREWKNNTSRLYYIEPCIEEWETIHNSCSCRQYNFKPSRIHIGQTRLTHGHLLSRNNQQPTCRSSACGNQSLIIKHCLQDCPQCRDKRKKHNIQGDLRTILKKDCEMEKMRFLREKGLFKEI